MTNEDKKLIAEYMGSYFNPARLSLFEYETGRDGYFDSNDASLCVKEMQKRGEFESFLKFSWPLRTKYQKEKNTLVEYFLYIFNPDNFFTAMAAWIKESKK